MREKEKAKPVKKTVSVFLNIDKELYDQIAEEAERSERAIVQQIRFWIKEALARGKK